MLQLGVNIDHVATIRQARRIDYPDPVEAAVLAKLGGADQITIHLREDRRHIQDRDLEILSRTLKIPLNLELALNDDVIEKALANAPQRVCIVPEKREEITTEGGLNVEASQKKLEEVIPLFKEKKIEVSLFIDPEQAMVAAAYEVGADAIELHTGAYANAKNPEAIDLEIERLNEAISTVIKQSETYSEFLKVNLGHGLNYHNLPMLLDALPLEVISELNIGHSIIARAIFVGLQTAVREMKELMWRVEVVQSAKHADDFLTSLFYRQDDDDDFEDDDIYEEQD